MSEIRVTNVLGENGNSPVNFTKGINMSGIVTATSFVPTTGQLSHRNLIINGDYRISQRSTSSTSNGYQTMDRWYMYSLNTGVTVTTAQVAVTSGNAYDDGFRKVAKISLSGAGTLAADSQIQLFTKLEGQDIANSGWNYKSASSFITLSFWVKSSTAQAFPVHIRTDDGTSYAYSFTYTVAQANVWQKITKSIPGNSNLTIDDDNGSGLRVYAAMPVQGSNFDGATADTWAVNATATRVPPVPDTWLTAGASTFEITGVQLEVGPVTTPFEHRSFGDELARCQRYYQQYVNISAVGYVPDNNARTYSHGFFFPVTMRAAPTMSITNTGSSGGQYITDGDTNRYIASMLSQGSKTTHMSVSFNLTGDLANFRGAYLFGTGNTSYQTTYKINAEL
tara:strand:+ start:45 stop:1226 length:1182 start_codon:yes stop_codon:yes gene_type:complete